MSHGTLGVLVLATALGSGLVAGIYLAFSTFVMRALGALPAARGIEAMQAINVAAPSPAFAVPLVGTAVLSLAVIAGAVADSGERAEWAIAGAVLYIASLAITMAFNVPLNNALAAAEPTADASERLWVRYLTVWTRWNHLRALAAGAGAAALTIALGAL